MPAESSKATITSFTGTGLVRVVNDSTGTPTSRNITPANLAADTAFADKFVQVVGDTMTGSLTTTGGTLRADGSSQGRLILRDTGAAADDKGFDIVSDGGALVIRYLNDALSSATQIAAYAKSTGTWSFNSTAVNVPAVSAASQAAQVTAYDAALGRLSVGGYEIGDTGWRNVSAGVINSHTASVLHLRRTGNTVSLRATLNSASATANGFYALPTGFQSDAGTTFMLSAWDGTTTWKAGYISGASAVATSSRGATTYVGGTWTTTDAWPSTLPGSAA